MINSVEHSQLHGCLYGTPPNGAVEKSKEIKFKIRNDFVSDTLEKCRAEGRALHNIMHSSESVEEAEKEIEVWLK